MTYYIVKKKFKWPFGILLRWPSIIGWSPVFAHYKDALAYSGNNGAAVITVEEGDHEPHTD